jgi:hypothetical protein
MHLIRFARWLPGLIIQSGWDDAAHRSSSGSPSPLRSPAACLCALHGKRAPRQPAFNGHRSSRATVAGAPLTRRNLPQQGCNFLQVHCLSIRNFPNREKTAISLVQSTNSSWFVRTSLGTDDRPPVIFDPTETLVRDRPKAIVVLFWKLRDILPGFRYRVPGLAGEWQAELFGKPGGIGG